MSIQILDHGRLREIRLARPPVNALDTALCQALTAAVQQVGSEVDGVVLSGSERIFSGGMDVPHLLSHGTNRGALLESWTAFSMRPTRWRTARCQWSRQSAGTRRPAVACWRCAAITG